MLGRAVRLGNLLHRFHPFTSLVYLSNKVRKRGFCHLLLESIRVYQLTQAVSGREVTIRAIVGRA